MQNVTDSTRKTRSRRVNAERPQVVGSTRKSMHQHLGPVPPQGMIQMANASRRRLLRRPPMGPLPPPIQTMKLQLLILDPTLLLKPSLDPDPKAEPVGSVQYLFNGIFSNTESN